MENGENRERKVVCAKSGCFFDTCLYRLYKYIDYIIYILLYRLFGGVRAPGKAKSRDKLLKV